MVDSHAKGQRSWLADFVNIMVDEKWIKQLDEKNMNCGWKSFDTVAFLW